MTYLLLDKLYSSEGGIYYVFINTETQRLYYHNNKEDMYTPRMLVENETTKSIENKLTMHRKTREEEYLKLLKEGKDEWSLRDQEWVDIKTVKKYDTILNKEVTLKEIHFNRPQGPKAYKEIFNSWEDEIQFVTRHGIDNNMPMGMLWENMVKNEYVPYIKFPNQEMKNYLLERGYEEHIVDYFISLMYSSFPKVNRVAIDIETHYDVTLKPNAKIAAFPIISIVTKTNNGQPSIVFSLRESEREEGIIHPSMQKKINKGQIIIKRFDREYDLLKDFFKEMRNQPQVLVTYNGDGFDLPYIKNRALWLGMNEKDIPIHVSASTKKKGTTKGFTDGIARWKGKIHLDIMKFFDNQSIRGYTFQGKYQSVKLDNVAEALLGEKKIDIGDMNKASYQKLIWYNYIDTKLTLNLTTFNKDLTMNVMIALMRITNTTLPDINRFGISTWSQNMIFTIMISNGMLVPNQLQLLGLTTKGMEEVSGVITGAKYKGGELMARKGYYFHVLGLDFVGLYPSVAERYNICFSTLNCSHPECISNKVPDTDYHICTKNKGIISQILGLIKDIRAHDFKPRGKAGDSIAYVMEQTQKVLVNAALGVFGNSYAKIYCPPVTACVTAYSRHAINSAERMGDNRGFICVYKHTDSIYVIDPTEKRISDSDTTDFINEIVDKHNLDIGIDNRFKFMIVHSKANYLGVRETATDVSGIKVAGMGGKKRNIPLVIKETFNNVKELLLPIHNEGTLEKQRVKIIKIISDKINTIQACQGDVKEYTFKTELGKNPSEYKTKPPHVRVAEQIANHRRHHEGVVGETDRIVPRGTIIEYVWVRKRKRVESLYTANIKNIDSPKYVKLLKSTLEQILENIHIDDLDLKGQRQPTLEEMFNAT